MSVCQISTPSPVCAIAATGAVTGVPSHASKSLVSFPLRPTTRSPFHRPTTTSPAPPCAHHRESPSLTRRLVLVALRERKTAERQHRGERAAIFREHAFDGDDFVREDCAAVDRLGR